MENQTNVDDFRPVYQTSSEQLLMVEFQRLDDRQCYVDHAGATLYSEKQLANICKELQENVYGNPHAKSSTSKRSEDSIDQIRFKILDHFNVTPNDYSVIFTSGATGALKLLAECFDYANDGCFAHLQDNHTSVLGMRAYAPNITSITYAQTTKIFNKPRGNIGSQVDRSTNSLFAYPAQCNFSGRKFPLEWIDAVHNGALNDDDSKLSSSRWYCVLDAAAYAATNRLNLAQYKPDFVCVSFYKMFGYPTGLGALLVKNASAHVLKKRYYGGGTVYMALSTVNEVVHRENLQEKFEDGTINYLSIMSIKHGFDTLHRVGIDFDQISRHTFGLAKYVYENLRALRHANGKSVARLYHDDDNGFKYEQQGGIVNFNLLRDDGSYIGYAEVMHIANLYNIALRTGCFCNPGACQRHLNVTTETLRYHFSMGHVCGDQYDLIDGAPTGSVRISFGYMSTHTDAHTLLTMISECFVSKHNNARIVTTTLPRRQRHNNELKDDVINGTLQSVYIYPIKSAGSYAVSDNNWELTAAGLKYDREWMIVDADGVAMTQKHETRLAILKPIIDCNAKFLILTFKDFPSCELPLDEQYYIRGVNAVRCRSKVCQNKIEAVDCGDDVAAWLDLVLNRHGLRLLRQCDERNASLANKAQYLMINSASVKWLKSSVPSEFDESLSTTLDRFRANFVVDFARPLIENDYRFVKFGNCTFESLGPCHRCQMICIDQSTGESSVEPLRTLAQLLRGKIQFGVYLKAGHDLKQIQLANVT